MALKKIVFFIFTTSILEILCQTNIVEELNKRYYNTSTVCFDSLNNKTQPIFQCSGIIIRGIKSRTNLTHAWDMKTLDKTRNSMSFAFLRKDCPFSVLVNYYYDAGFILFPILATPIEKIAPKIICAFPFDSNSDRRHNRGCGYWNDTVGTSDECDIQNITTFEHWNSHFNEIVNRVHPRYDRLFPRGQCSFNLSSSNSIRNFNIFLEAVQFLRKETDLLLSHGNNEIKIEGWNEINVKQLPIQAFFYIINSENGHKHAIKFQSDFFIESGGEMIPIVGIRLPNQRNTDIEIQNG